MSQVKFTDKEAEMLLMSLRERIRRSTKNIADIEKHQATCNCESIVGKSDEKDIQARIIIRQKQVIQTATDLITKVRSLS